MPRPAPQGSRAAGRKARPPEYYRALAARGRPDYETARGLRALCAGSRDSLLARGVPEAVLDAEWPGGANNPGPETLRKRAPWVRCFAIYTAMVRETAKQNRAAELDAALRRAHAEALEDRPEYVDLTVGRMAVYPKSCYALEELDRLDAAIAVLAGVDLFTSQLTDPTQIAALIDAPVLRSLAVRTWAWIITHEGPELPYGDADIDPQHPDWTLRFTPHDLLLLWHGHQKVNRERNRILIGGIPHDPQAGKSRLDFSGFIGSFTGAKHLDPFEVLRRWSLGRVLALAVGEAIAADEAKQRAERERLAKEAAQGAPLVGPITGARRP